MGRNLCMPLVCGVKKFGKRISLQFYWQEQEILFISLSAPALKYKVIIWNLELLTLSILLCLLNMPSSIDVNKC
jgi:hypothetical protein